MQWMSQAVCLCMEPKLKVYLFKLKKEMKTISGTYFNGELKLDKPLKTKKPIRVKLVVEEDLAEKDILKVSDFSFLEMQELLKNCKGSMSEELVNERQFRFMNLFLILHHCLSYTKRKKGQIP